MNCINGFIIAAYFKLSCLDFNSHLASGKCLLFDDSTKIIILGDGAGILDFGTDF